MSEPQQKQARRVTDAQVGAGRHGAFEATAPKVAAGMVEKVPEIFTISSSRERVRLHAIVAEDGTVVGIVTESDIVRVLMAGTHLELFFAGQVMTTPAITVNLDTPVEEVMGVLVKNRIVQVPTKMFWLTVELLKRSSSNGIKSTIKK
jgi:CBS domain-containing protein